MFFCFSTYIHAVHPLNTSDHTAITAKIPLLTKKAVETNTKEENNNQGKPFQKPRWGKCDKQLYRETVEKLMHEANINPQVDSNTLLGLEISKLETVLQHATETSIEGHQTHASANKPRGRGKWNSKIAEASRHSKAVHKRMKESNDNSIELRKEQKEAKNTLRRLQRQQAHTEREVLYKEIMEAEKEDQQLFYRLLSKQRKNYTKHNKYHRHRGK